MKESIDPITSDPNFRQRDIQICAGTFFGIAAQMHRMGREYEAVSPSSSLAIVHESYSIPWAPQTFMFRGY